MHYISHLHYETDLCSAHESMYSFTFLKPSAASFFCAYILSIYFWHLKGFSPTGLCWYQSWHPLLKCFQVRSCDAKVIISAFSHNHRRQARGVPMHVGRVKCLLSEWAPCNLEMGTTIFKAVRWNFTVYNFPAQLLLWLMQHICAFPWLLLSNFLKLLQAIAVCCHCSIAKFMITVWTPYSLWSDYWWS